MIISLDKALHFHGRSGPEDGPSLHEFLSVQIPDVLPDMAAIREALWQRIKLPVK